jgi:hypothetical protein
MRGSLRLPAVPSILAAVALVASADSGLTQSTSRGELGALLGTWRLDVDKSRYFPGPPPRSETRTYVRDAQGVKGTIRREHADGRVEVIEYRADYDHDYPVAGATGYDSLRLKRIDTHTAEAVLSHAGRVFGTASRVISRDGATLTIEFRRGDDDGLLVNNVTVFRKQP